MKRVDENKMVITFARTTGELEVTMWGCMKIRVWIGLQMNHLALHNHLFHAANGRRRLSIDYPYINYRLPIYHP